MSNRKRMRKIATLEEVLKHFNLIGVLGADYALWMKGQGGVKPWKQRVVVLGVGVGRTRGG